MSDDNPFCLAYAPMTMRAAGLEVVGQVNLIIDEYRAQGLSLTLRQVYYQMVARGLIPNSDREYNKLGRIVSDGRVQGLIPWDAIEDRNRSLKGLRTFKKPEDAIKAAAKAYRADLWKNQPWRPEVWVEKDALSGVIQGVCNRHRVDFFACKGYASQSEMWRAGQRLAGYVKKGQRPIVFHLGDHDPSGIDMTRDNTDRLRLFAGVPIQVVRLALNRDQVDEVNPPPNPAKLSDSRAEDYVRIHGYESWELDALDPSYIDRLIHGAVDQLKDQDLWDEALLEEVTNRNYLLELAGATEGEDDE